MSQATLSPVSTSPVSTDAAARDFVDRRSEDPAGSPGRERRQFADSHDGLSDEAADLARAIDAYKAKHRRRFINYEEMLSVIRSLGYSR